MICSAYEDKTATSIKIYVYQMIGRLPCNSELQVANCKDDTGFLIINPTLLHKMLYYPRIIAYGGVWSEVYARIVAKAARLSIDTSPNPLFLIDSPIDLRCIETVSDSEALGSVSV